MSVFIEECLLSRLTHYLRPIGAQKDCVMPLLCRALHVFTGESMRQGGGSPLSFLAPTVEMSIFGETYLTITSTITIYSTSTKFVVTV